MSATCFIRVYQDTGGGFKWKARGTGWFISPNIIITAAHVVAREMYPHSKRLRFVVQVGADSRKSVGIIKQPNVLVHKSWTGRRGDPHDLALLQAKDGLLPPHKPFRTYTDVGLADLHNKSVEILGYRYGRGIGEPGLWYSPGRLVFPGGLNRGHLVYLAPTQEGFSGGPLFAKVKQNGQVERRVVGLHVGGPNSHSYGPGLGLGVILRSSFAAEANKLDKISEGSGSDWVRQT